MIWEILFWSSVIFLIHSYFVFPFLLSLLSRNKKLSSNYFTDDAEFPFVSVLMSVYNEEKVIGDKIKSVFETSYPKTKLEMLIGSDGSTDKTDLIIEQLIQQGFNIQFKKFGGRNGKSTILNKLVPSAKGTLFIFTDANIYFEHDTIKNLARHFKNETVGLVGANIINSGLRRDGISQQEKTYIERENKIKYHEGLIWGTMMGAFGACYAMRSELFPGIPANFLMEDFYITMSVLNKNKKAISDLDARAHEDVSNLVTEEFKRKVRISAGNFQNLGVYYPLLKNPFSGTGFCFLSHKVLRWLGPSFLITAFICSSLLFYSNSLYRILFYLQVAGFITPFIDALLSRLNIHNFALRLISYFYTMNFALLLGFIKYIKGIRTSTWTPTERNI